MAPTVEAMDGLETWDEFLSIYDFYVSMQEKVGTWLWSGGRLRASATP